LKRRISIETKRLISVLFILALALAYGRASAQVFTIAVIPDAQGYSDYRCQTDSKPPFFMDQADIFYRQTAYVAANAASAGGRIAFAAFLGDLVNSNASRPSEWAVAEKAVSELDGMLPFGIVPGNHDYDRKLKDAKGKLTRVDGHETFSRYFGPGSKHFKDMPWYGGSFDEGLDSFSTFEVGGRTFLFLGLELEPSNAALAWADEVLDAHPGLPTILATHEYLSCYDEAVEPGRARLANHSYREGMDRNTPRQVWEKLVSRRSQIFLVLCGHYFNGATQGEGLRVDRDDAGYTVYQLLSDYQGRAEIQARRGIFHFPGRCGDGWMRLMEFDLAKREIHVRTYSTELERYETDSDSDFRLKLDWDWEERLGH
jgi:hypothetical protein